MDRAFSLLILLLGLTTFSAQAAPGLSLSSTAVAVDANTALIHTISGISSGETITVERFADVNNNGAIDFGEPALRSFVVQDGVQSRIGGVVNGNVPGDNDGAANGSIRIELPFPGVDVILNRQPGKYIVRITGASGTATAPLEINAPNHLQRVTGVLKNSANNATIPFGIVVVLVGDGLPIGSVRTDAIGAFNFIAPPGDYGLVPIADGFAAPFQFVSIPANQTVTQNIMLTPAPVRISGKLSDATTGVGLSSVFILGQSGHDGDGDLSGALTDSNGNFGFNVTPGMWEIRPMSEQAAQLGYVVDEAGPTVPVTAGPLTQNVTARKATALLYGRVTDPSNAGVANLPLRGRQQTPLNLESFGRTSANGDYFVGLIDGSWEVNSDGASVELGYREISQSITIAAGSATRSDIQLAAATAYIRGRVVNGAGMGMSDMTLQGRHENSQQSSSSTTTSSDGSFELPVWGGNWTLELEQDGMVSPTIRLTVVDGVDQNITITVPNSTGQINGSVKNSSGAGVGEVFVMAHATINNVEYKSGRETDSNGNFQLPVINGSWSVSLSCNDLQERNYNCPNNQNAIVNNSNATVNFTLQNFVTTASLNGRVVDAAGAPLSGIQVGAQLQSGGTSRSGFSQADGSFSIPVFAGTWNVYISNTQSYISPNQSVTVTDGVNVNNLLLKLYATDATISGTVKNSAGAAITGINVYASAVIDGSTYSVPLAVTDGSGSFTLAVSRGSWSVNLDCNQLSALQYNCSNIPAIDTTSGSALVNITVTSQGPPQIELPTINQSGQIPIFRFTLRGAAGTYDILGSPAIPFTWSQVATTTISFGGQTATPEFNPGTNRFFKVQLRP